MITLNINQLSVPSGAASYLEFLRQSSMSMGLYRLEAGASDPQLPHSEDEVYVVLKGEAMIRVGEEDAPVREGSVVFVAKFVPHHFHSITTALDVLVFFAPAEYSNQSA
ncbi:MAG: cupin domain-containing protein [Fimbriimonadaceae bacterium]